MKEITLGKTGIKTPQNAFGALPIQRVTMDEAVKILQRAYEGGMTFFDTARAYSDSEEKLGQAFEGMSRGLLSILELLPTILKRLFSVFSQDFMRLCSFLSVIFALKERLSLLICVRKRMLAL